MWPQENRGSEPAPPLPPIIGGEAVGGEGDDAWLVPGEVEQVLLGGEMGAQNASWMVSPPPAGRIFRDTHGWCFFVALLRG